jgi:ArsR family transcriptional regulator
LASRTSHHFLQREPPPGSNSGQSQNPAFQRSFAVPALPWSTKPRLRYSPGLAPTLEQLHHRNQFADGWRHHRQITRSDSGPEICTDRGAISAGRSRRSKRAVSAREVDIKGCIAPVSISSSNNPSDLLQLQLARVAKVLAEPQRMRILRNIAASEESHVPCDSLCAALNFSRPTVSHHIRQLEWAGLLVVSRPGKFADLTLNRKELRAYAGSLMHGDLLMLFEGAVSTGLEPAVLYVTGHRCCYPLSKLTYLLYNPSDEFQIRRKDHDEVRSVTRRNKGPSGNVQSLRRALIWRNLAKFSGIR